jgi:hypothetical protein
MQNDDGAFDDYVPRNMPAIGDLFDLFDFGGSGNRDRQNGDRDNESGNRR